MITAWENATAQHSVLDKGYIELIDYMPHPATGVSGDLAIVNAARVSFMGQTKGEEADKKLLFYLLKHQHCYRGDMQVLTAQGWKRWEECNDREVFAVPNPETKRIAFENLQVKRFESHGSQEMYTFRNNRMSYAVTKGHKMRFMTKWKGLQGEDFEQVKIEDMSKWGWFDMSNNYSLVSDEDGIDDYFWLLGFFLGDGAYASSNRIAFHLKKHRKITKLMNALKSTEYQWSFKENGDDTVTIYAEIPEFFRQYLVEIKSHARDKSFDLAKIDKLTNSQLKGLFYGLVDSDGSYKRDRDSQIEFSTTSQPLAELFQLLAALNGFDAHIVGCGDDITCIIAYSTKTRTSLESRAQYHDVEQYDGDVYCATTSTGWLIVRGDETEFAFICGNTSPFEQVQFKFRVKAPLLVWWQWIRHRTFHYQSINSQSGRYTPFREDEFYFPREWRLQSADNKQGSDGVISEDRERLIYNAAAMRFSDDHWLNTEFVLDDDEVEPTLSQVLASYSRLGYQIYNQLVDQGVAKEQARLFLPGFGVYYTWVLSVDALNLMNFLRLRMADDAQWEIRQYADIIYKEMFKPLLPWTSSAFEQFVLKAGK